jgi:CBS domain-containing membrane protein
LYQKYLPLSKSIEWREVVEENQITLTGEDFREALKEFGTYVDITEDDLKKLYEIAVKISRERCVHAWLAEEIMSRDVVSVKGDTDIHEAGRILIRNKISGMPVVDNENRVVGMFCTLDLLVFAGIARGHVFNDIVMKYILRKPDPRHGIAKKVEDIMSTSVITVSTGTSVTEIAGILDKKRIKRVPVVDEGNKLVGLVARGDILRIICEDAGKDKRAPL